MTQNQDTLHSGIVYAVIMLDDMKHQVQPDGSISRCLDISCPCWDEQDEDPEDDMEERLARQEQQHIEDRAKRDMWGCYNDDDDLRFNAWHGSNRD